MLFPEALHLLKHGAKIRRQIWPRGVYLFLYNPPMQGAKPLIVAHHNHHLDYDYRASSSDMLGHDWEEALE